MYLYTIYSIVIFITDTPSFKCLIDLLYLRICANSFKSVVIDLHITFFLSIDKVDRLVYIKAKQNVRSFSKKKLVNFKVRFVKLFQA